LVTLKQFGAELMVNLHENYIKILIYILYSGTFPGKTYFCIYCIVDIWMIFLDSVHGPVLLSDPSHPREAPQGILYCLEDKWNNLKRYMEDWRQYTAG
jgi:hypothetical protein